ncbi:MAG: hypothetical protein LUC43_00740, partial [Burkholderiales bacterium]|nr:hypothetical protein [Burkholderiales bacterium]
LFAFNDTTSGTAPVISTGVTEESAAQFFTVEAGNININIYGNDDPNQKEGSVYGYYANSGSYVNTILRNINITVMDAEELSENATSTGGIYGIHYNKNNSTLTADNIYIHVANGYDGKGTYGYHSDQSTGNNSTVTLNSITLLAENYQGADGYLRGIEKQGNEILTVKGNVSVTGSNVTEGRITGVFSRGGNINIGGNVQLYIRDVNDGNPGEDNMTGIWLARSGSVNVSGSVVVSYIDDSNFHGTFNQNITGIGIMKVDHVGATTTATQNASVNVGGNLIVQLGGDAESIGLKNHTVYGTVNNGTNSNITFTNGKRYLFFGTDENNGTETQTFSSLASDGQHTTFKGSFSNFDSIVVTSGSSLYLGVGQTMALAGEDDLFQTTQITQSGQVVGFAPVLNFVNFLNGERTSKNVTAGVINGIVSMGGVLSMAENTSMEIKVGGLANIWLLQNESGAKIKVDGTLELSSASVFAEAIGTSSRLPGSGVAYNKGDILGAGKLVLQAATPTDTTTYHTYTYTGVTNSMEVTTGNSAFENSGLIAVSTLEIGKGFELQNSGNIYVENLTATHALINSTGEIDVIGTIKLTGSEVTSTHTISAGNIILNGFTIDIEDEQSAMSSVTLGDQAVRNSTITTTEPIVTGSLSLNYSTLTSSSTVTVSENLSVAGYATYSALPSYSGNLQITHSELNAQEIIVSGELSASHAAIEVANAVYAESLQLDDTTLESRGPIAVSGNMTFTNSAISAFSPAFKSDIARISYDLNSTEALSAGESITLSNSHLDTDLPIIATNLSLDSSTLKTIESVSVVGNINVTNDSSVTTSGSTTAKALTITEASEVFSDGNITTGTLTVINGTLTSGKDLENVAIKTNNFAFNQGEILINNGTFEAYQTASLTGGTFILGSDSTTVEVHLNPVTISKSTPLNLNTGFEVNN